MRQASLARASTGSYVCSWEALSMRTMPEDANFSRDNGLELLDCWEKMKGGISLSGTHWHHTYARMIVCHTYACMIVWGAHATNHANQLDVLSL